ncbi:DUF692 family multinuclear iron-containing protein [Streptomyces sp. NPDC094143]|uniref:multinuclear nonheme iron-dependent oxidase n=1 Tax=Streptomyces sp. NPDC094143 TaxID=3155310 RepID=UPI00332F48D2
MERLGTGIGWRPEIADAVERMPGIDWVEAVAENVCPGHLPDSLRRLRERGVTVVPHGVSLGLGGAERPDEGRLAALAERVTALGSPLVTEHIAFVRAGGALTASPRLEAGHLLPVPRTRDALDVLCENVRIAQDALPVPLAVENIAALISWPAEEMTEGQFLYELADRTGVGLLIDVANLHTNHVNRGEDPAKALAELPLEAIAYVHVAGGFERDGVWHDSHAHPVPRPVLDILTDLASRVRPPGVLLERDENFPEAAELHSELASIRRAVETGAVERVKAELREAGRTAARPATRPSAPGSKVPRVGAGVVRAGTEESRAAAEAPQAGAGVPDTAAETLAAGVVTPRAGAEEPRGGVAAPRPRAAIPDTAAETPEAGVVTPRAAAEAPRPSAGVPPTVAETPEAETGRPRYGAEASRTEAGVARAAADTPEVGTETPEAGAEMPEAGTAVLRPGDETGAVEATRGAFGLPHPRETEAAGQRPGGPGAARPRLGDVVAEARQRPEARDEETLPRPEAGDPVAETQPRPEAGDPVAEARQQPEAVDEEARDEEARDEEARDEGARDEGARDEKARPRSEVGVGEARQRVGLAQAALLSALVAGTPVPEGFDRARIGVQARALAAKRADVVAKVAPELPVILGREYRVAFLGYAQTNPMTGGYRRDALTFAEHLLAAGRPGETQARRELREWWLERSGPAPRSARPVRRLARATRRALLRR